MDTYVNKVKHDVITNLKRNNKKNVNDREEEAISKLMKDDSIVIRPSDKGSQIVVLDTFDYR